MQTWNPRVWLRNWLSKPTKAAREVATERAAKRRAASGMTIELDRNGYPVGLRSVPEVKQS